MKQSLMKLPEPFIRLLLVFIVFVGLTVVTWAYVIPPSLKDRAYHKSTTIEREMAKPISYAGSSICFDCHEDTYDTKRSGAHLNLSCETCHGPSWLHSEDPLEVTPEVPRDRQGCARCHEYDTARPTGFPQVNVAAHNPDDPCISCHNPHDPEPLVTPEECESCHAEIARTKAVSPHSSLECVTCHETPEAHKITPRVVRPSKPNARSACGQCHAENAENPKAPKINITTHEEKYVCWQCHYPHMPEVN